MEYINGLLHKNTKFVELATFYTVVVCVIVDTPSCFVYSDSKVYLCGTHLIEQLSSIGYNHEF